MPDSINHPPSIEARLHHLAERLRSAYDSIGHSSGRPYVYFVYPPGQERVVRRLVEEQLRSDSRLCFYQVDLLPLTSEALNGQEARRQELLNGPVRGASGADPILRLWAKAVLKAIAAAPKTCAEGGRTVVVRSGLAALHPLGNPTNLMEAVAEVELREPGAGPTVPIVLLVPGVRPIGSSRTYQFLGREDLNLQFYRGEEM